MERLKMKNMKKAFTLAETLVVLGVISFIAIILLPTLKNIKPNNEHLMFRKVYYLTSNLVSEIINNSDLYPEPDDDVSFFLSNVSDVTYYGENYGGDTKFCKIFSSKLNTSGPVQCEEKAFVDNNTPDSQFRTADGVHWILPITRFEDKDVEYPIYVDTNGDKMPNCAYDEESCKKPDRFTIYIKRDGKLIINGEKEREYLEKTDVTGG